MLTRTEITTKRRDNQSTWGKMDALLTKAKGEKRSLNADEQAEWKKLDDEFEARGKEIDAGEAELDREQRHKDRQADLAKLDGRRAGRDGGEFRGDGKHDPTAEERAFEKKLFRSWAALHPSEWDDEIREGITKRRAALPKEARALSQITGASGAFTIAQSFMPELERAMKSYSGILQGCRVLQTGDGSDLPWPKVNDTGNTGALLTENSAAATNVDPAFTQTILKSYVFTSNIVLVPVPLLQDEDIDIEAFLFDALAERIGRAFNTYGTTGTGTSQPRGLITALAADTTPFTFAGASAITYADLVNLFHKVDPAYRTARGVGWMFHDNILSAIKQIMDSNGRPLFMPAGDAPGSVANIMGYPYFINQDMASTIATTNRTVVFGALQKYIVRRAGPSIMMRLAERYADAFQVGFVAFQRLEGQLVQATSGAANLAVALGKQA
jgi:HK97 family phage major capsid protein